MPAAGSIDDVDCDVAICGLGPVGQLLANLLGQLGVSTIAVDEADGPHDLPRAAVVDDEVLRIFQAVGLDRAVLAAAQAQRGVTYVTAAGRPIEVFRTDTSVLGHPALASIHQPSFERVLVEGLERYECVDARWRERVVSLERHDGHVVVRTRSVDGDGHHAIRARWLVGCDGASSAVRDQLGIEFGGSTFVQRWLVVDVLVDRPLTRAHQPHFLGDPARPVVCLPMSPGRHRWEWMLHPDEDEAPFLEPTRIRELMEPWLAGESVEVERAVVYAFHARQAASWRAGRVLLAGDAAHVMPPFVGQGFSSGARDVANLAWKLEAVLHGASERLLDSYEAERRPHVTGMQKLAVRWGGVVQTTSPRVGRLRDAVLVTLDRSGLLRAIGDRAKPLPTYRRGAFAQVPKRLPPRRSVGALFPQPEVIDATGERRLLDDLIGPGWAAICTAREAASAFAGSGVTVLELGRDAVDDSGAIGTWLARHHAEWVLLRPDRYVFACGARDEVAAGVLALRRLVGDPLRPSPKGA